VKDLPPSHGGSLLSDTMEVLGMVAKFQSIFKLFIAFPRQQGEEGEWIGRKKDRVELQE